MTGKGLRVKQPPRGETINKHQWYLSVCVTFEKSKNLNVMVLSLEREIAAKERRGMRRKSIIRVGLERVFIYQATTFCRRL